MKLFESELRVLKILWRRGSIPASEVAKEAGTEYDWSVTTTYTVIKKCITKEFIQRKDPGFICHPLISEQQVQAEAARELINRLFNGKTDCLVASLAQQHTLSLNDCTDWFKVRENYEQ